MKVNQYLKVSLKFESTAPARSVWTNPKGVEYGTCMGLSIAGYIPSIHTSQSQGWLKVSWPIFISCNNLFLVSKCLHLIIMDLKLIMKRMCLADGVKLTVLIKCIQMIQVAVLLSDKLSAILFSQVSSVWLECHSDTLPCCSLNWECFILYPEGRKVWIGHSGLHKWISWIKGINFNISSL